MGMLVVYVLGREVFPVIGAGFPSAESYAREVTAIFLQALAAKLGARVEESRAEPVDLIVVGSAPGATDGHIVVGGDVRSELSRARSSVIVLPAGAPALI